MSKIEKTQNVIFLTNYRVIIDDMIKFEVKNFDVVEAKADILVNTSN